MPTLNGRNYTGNPGINIREANGCIRFETPLITPTTTSGERLLYVDSSNHLIYDNGSSAVVLGATGGGATPTWETIFGVDQTLALTTATMTISQSAAAAVLTLTKTNSSTGSVLALNNAGTGKDIYTIKTEEGASGPEWAAYHNSASPATNDVVFTLNVSGNSSVGTTREYGKITFIATDKTDGSEDASFNLYEMLAGTSRLCFKVVGCTAQFGYGAAAILTSQGNYDLTLQTGNSTTSYINITDGAAGNIAFVLDTTGVVTVTTGIQTGGTTPTACIFNVAGSSGGGATGYGAKVNATTLTTGTAFLVDSASSSSGYLLDLQLATVSVFKVSETGATVIAGSAGNDILTITAGDVLLSDASITMTDADDAASFTVTNNASSTASMFVVAGSHSFSGNTTSSFMTITPSGLTTGTAVYLPVAALTQGKALHVAAGATITTGNLLYVQATGAACAATSGRVAFFDMTGTAVNANKSGQVVSVTSNRTVTTGAAVDDFDCLSIVRSDTINGAGSFSKAGSVLYVENATTNTSGTITDATNGIEIVMDADGAGIGVSLTMGAAAAVGYYGVNNALTTGAILSLASSNTTIATGGRIFLSTHSGNAAVSATLNEFISAAADETIVLAVTGSAALAGGKLVNLSAAACTTGTILDISDNTAHTTGTALKVVTNSSNTGTRSLVYVKQGHSSASGATPLEILNDGALPCIKITAAATSTHFYPAIKANGITIWISDGTTANGALSGTAGDLCLNAGSNKPEMCTGTTNWTALV